jgi:hypothetical protein
VVGSILEAEPDKWVALNDWVSEATENPQNAETKCCGHDVRLSSTLLHARYMQLRKKRIEKNCEIIAENYFNNKMRLVVVLTGGGFVCDITAEEVEKKMKVLPHLKFLTQSYINPG